MGIYCYTRRADAKMVETGETITRFDYAYKLGSYYGDSYMKRKIALLESHADKACDKTSGAKYGFLGSWVYAQENEGIPIFEIDDTMAAILDTGNHLNYVGTLFKRGKRMWIELKEKG